MKRKYLLIASLLFFCFFVVKNCKVEAASKVYGILIADQKQTYTYYDLNGVKGTQKVEKSGNGTVMIPVKKVCSYIPVLSYKYDWNSSTVTIRNTKNGKWMTMKANSQYAYTYASRKAKSKKVKLAAKTYLSKGSGAAMVDNKALKYVFAGTSGYKSFLSASKTGKKAIAEGYYHTPGLAGIYVFNPYKTVKNLPKATTVKYKSEKDLSNIAKVTIPEGYSVAQIAELMVKKRVCQSKTAFLKAVNKTDTAKYKFLKGIKVSESRCFLLEGYLYPSTYEFYRNTSPQDVIRKILLKTATKYTDVQVTRANQLGYTWDEILSIASIIEKEVSVSSERNMVSSVLHNRLHIGMRLQCDATINYVERYIKPYITGDINRYNAYYNTYKCKGIPGGPICNPGSQAIESALSPANSDYLYFCSDKKATYYYAATWEEHQKNVANLGL